MKINKDSQPSVVKLGVIIFFELLLWLILIFASELVINFILINVGKTYFGCRLSDTGLFKPPGVFCENKMFQSLHQNYLYLSNLPAILFFVIIIFFPVTLSVLAVISFFLASIQSYLNAQFTNLRVIRFPVFLHSAGNLIFFKRRDTTRTVKNMTVIFIFLAVTLLFLGAIEYNQFKRTEERRQQYYKDHPEQNIQNPQSPRV